jgi:hypothetical protein
VAPAAAAVPRIKSRREKRWFFISAYLRKNVNETDHRGVILISKGRKSKKERPMGWSGECRFVLLLTTPTLPGIRW